uniref:hypothetical protein n=1 Tax=Lachnoclostridium phocaeense TaxID=1871021 RepID=UPI0026DD2A13|nr:hypothetical protein [Lachnoclostridium phocaeense]
MDKIIINKNTITNLIIFLLLVLTFVFPLSVNGIPSTLYEVIADVLLLLFALILWIRGKKPAYKNLIVFFVLLYLFWATIIAIDGSNGDLKFGYARTICIIVTLLLFANNFSFCSDLRYYKKIIDFLVLGIVLINIISLLNLININSLLSNYYTQYLQYITDYQFTIRKPIMTFGVHNIASFVYEGLLLVSYYWYTKFGEKKHIIYTIIFLALLMMLRCSTSIAYLLFDVIIIVYYQTRSPRKLILTIIGFTALIFIAFQFDLIDVYRDILGQQTNGWISRYSNGIQTIFAENIDAIRKYPIGTGFSIAAHENGLYGADSGFIINFTIGKIVYFICFYALLIKKVNSFCKKKFISYIFIGYILIMELGFVTFLYYKTISFIIVLFSILCCTESNRYS